MAGTGLKTDMDTMGKAMAQKKKQAAEYAKDKVKKVWLQKTAYGDSKKIEWREIRLFENGVQKSRIACIVKLVEDEETGKRTWKILRGSVPKGEKPSLD